MSALNIFLDGSWLFRACAAGKVLASRTENPDFKFSLDFNRMNESLLQHVVQQDPQCDNIGDAYIATSIFSLPDDLDDWPDNNDDVTRDQIERVKRGVHSRTEFVRNATDAGYLRTAVLTPRIKAWMIEKLENRSFQEKQVDSSVVALLVKYAITKPNDYHVLITGDADALPAVQVAYPEYTRNVVIATTHPDQLSAEHRQASFSLLDFQFDIEPYFLSQRVEQIIYGNHPYRCEHCGRIFVRQQPIPQRAQPCCRNCHQQRQP